MKTTKELEAERRNPKNSWMNNAYIDVILADRKGTHFDEMLERLNGVRIAWNVGIDNTAMGNEVREIEELLAKLEG